MAFHHRKLDQIHGYNVSCHLLLIQAGRSHLVQWWNTLSLGKQISILAPGAVIEDIVAVLAVVISALDTFVVTDAHWSWSVAGFALGISLANTLLPVLGLGVSIFALLALIVVNLSFLVVCLGSNTARNWIFCHASLSKAYKCKECQQGEEERASQSHGRHKTYTNY